LLRIASAVAEEKLKLARDAIAAGRDGLTKIPCIGPWTIEYVALLGLDDPDAFPLSDSALRAAFDGDLKRTNQTWRPWRAYAAARLWRRSGKMERQAA
jgi:AraC family transcriptional regulator, regulatory protein of adaptative response / DNA-3-methyladenine glycosylase II